MKKIQIFCVGIFWYINYNIKKNANEICLMTKPNDKTTFFRLKSNNENVRDDLDHDIQLSENLF